ncbi:acetyl-CoA C-acetyltransferase [Marinitoga litoralis]|uniref:acetyl-CoA C-acetyltransferase n=1 Tax=Marinitoga litoralis TaxID=570855 RepID=UPI00195F32E1|nr:acetyl-CoA C-acetyltransferase [Marinitoga litoralis]MBM7560099.1 acetyl-CoA C-acetyltransferase [Marinitoga litoralis]
MEKVYIVGAKRTAIGSFLGTLKDKKAAELGAEAIKGAMEQAGVKPEQIDQTIVGNVLMAGQGMGPARQAAIYAGILVEKPAYTVHMVCGSGMKAIMLGANEIRLGNSEIVAVAGMESMSNAPMLLPAKAREGLKFGNIEMIDHMVYDGLTDVFNQYHMGITAENLVEKYGITREEQDEFAATSQQRAEKAIKEGKFKDEIIPIEIKTRKETKIFDTDEYPRFGTTKETLAKLRPAFKKDGTVTAGNSSGINDGASAMIIASESAVKKYGLTPLAEIIAYEQGGVDPSIMGIGPAAAITNLVEKKGIKLEEIELFELNEAFAAQSIAVLKELKERYGIEEEWMMERTNVNGGAIALGHPIGASGNRIVVTLLYEMKKRNLEYGLASLCIGGGMGTAIVIKNL